jgi:hypothetical protein
VRSDFNENSNSQWFGRYSWTDEFTVKPGLTVDGQTLYTRASQWLLSNTRVFSSTKVNEARFGYNSLYSIIGQQLAGVEDVDSEIGVPRGAGEFRSDSLDGGQHAADSVCAEV